MNCPRYFAFLLLMLFFAFNKTNGQTSSYSNQSASYKNAKVYFQNETGEDAHLYTGEQYTGYEKNIKGYPFFVSPLMQNGDIFYNGSLYQNVPLLFDIVRQEIVINRYNQNFRIKLLNEKVKYFTLAGHRFENITVTEGKDENIVNGIYDIVFDGKTSVFVKRIKRIKYPFKAEDPPGFIEEDVFYIRTGNTMYAVDNRSTLLQALNDKRELIKTYVRKNKLKFKKKIEKELIMIAVYYSTLNK